MVNAVRSFLPTDLLALVVHTGLSYENEAWPRERLGAGESQATLNVVRDQLLSLARRRGALVSVRRQRLQGLVGTRQRGGKEAWEIDYFIDATRDRRVAVDLLEGATAEAGKEGAHKLFLRLSADSDLLSAAHEAGFVPYKEETLYGATEANLQSRLDLRPFVASDSYPLFRLYCEVTPEATRRFEAATLSEWHAAQEQRWLRNGRRLVLETDGRLHALVQAGRLPHGLLVDLIVDDDAAREAAGIVGAASQGALEAGEPVLVLVPNSSEGTARRLVDAGFAPRGEYVSLVRRTARPMAMPRTAVVVAKNAIGV
jgi:hypothetical protein